MKEHVLGELPPKRRQIIRLLLKRADIDFAIAATRVTKCDASENNVAEEKPSDNKPDGIFQIFIPPIVCAQIHL